LKANDVVQYKTSKDKGKCALRTVSGSEGSSTKEIVYCALD